MTRLSPQKLPLVLQTAYAELLDRCAVDAFESAFSEKGSFVAKTVKGRRYWYFQIGDGGQKQRYVGPETPELLVRIEAHRAAHADYRERRKLVSTLLRSAHLPRPDSGAGEVLSALAKAGVFRLRAILVGTIAYQTYAPMLGVRLPQAAVQTGDVDIAQFRAVSIAVEDRTPPILDVLRAVDPTFQPVPHRLERTATTAYRSRSNLRVEFLVPNRGPNRDAPDRLPALATDAQPLRFLDFLIYEAVPAIVLHEAGVYVNVPSPQRYALHKLIVAQRRQSGSPKIDKDLRQAAALIEVLAATRRHDLSDAWHELVARGPKWRQLASRGLEALPGDARAALTAAAEAGVND